MGKRGSVANQGKRTSGKAVSLSSSALRPSVGMTPRAKTVWGQIVSAFPAGHFTEADRMLLEEFCEAMATHRQATARIQKEGRYYTDVRGARRKHPACDDQHQARCDCAMLATKLRMTKQAMTSPKVAGRAAQDAADAVNVKDSFGGLLFNDEAQVRQ